MSGKVIEVHKNKRDRENEENNGRGSSGGKVREMIKK